MLNIGYSQYISKRKIVSIHDTYLGLQGQPVNRINKALKKVVELAQQAGRYIDCTRGKRRRSIIITDNNVVYATTIASSTLNSHWRDNREVSRNT